MHYHYYVYGRSLSSNIPLPELPEARFAGSDIAFLCRAPAMEADALQADSRLVLRRDTNLGRDVRLYETATGLLVRWESLGDFTFSQDGHRIEATPCPNTDIAWVRQALYNTALSFALHLMGTSNLHGSAVLLPHGVSAFLAGPGSGKSTLAAALTAEGFPFLTDDIVVIGERDGRFHTFAGFPYVSLARPLREDASGTLSGAQTAIVGREKTRVHVDGRWGRFEVADAPLKNLYCISRSETAQHVQSIRLPAPLAVMTLLSNTVLLPLLPREVLARHMAFLGRLVTHVPVWRLIYSSGYERLPAVLDSIVRSQKA